MKVATGIAVKKASPNCPVPGARLCVDPIMRVTATWLETHQTVADDQPLIDGETWCFSEKRFCYTSFTIFYQPLLPPFISDHDPDELMHIFACIF